MSVLPVTPSRLKIVDLVIANISNSDARAAYLTLLRDPTECFESNYVYMGLQSAFGMDINQGCHVPPCCLSF